MFVGLVERKIGSRGRVGFPAGYRKALSGSGGQVVVTRTLPPNAHVLLFPAAPGWELLVRRAARTMGKDEQSARLLWLWLVGASYYRRLDKRGGLTLPPELRTEARLSGPVRVAGKGGWLELRSVESRARNLSEEGG